MAKEEKEMRDVYWVSLKERDEKGIRTTLEKHVYESAGGAYKKYEELIYEWESKQTDKMLIVDILFIKDGCFNTIREKHLWDMKECGNN